jgi:hypothetical protein
MILEMPGTRNFFLAPLGEGPRQDWQGPKHRIPPDLNTSPHPNPSALLLSPICPIEKSR